MGGISLLLTGGRVLRSGAAQPERLDLAIDHDGRIASIGPSLSAPDARVIDLGGKLVVPGLVDAHQHLDKSRTRRSVHNPSGTLARRDRRLPGFRGDGEARGHDRARRAHARHLPPARNGGDPQPHQHRSADRGARHRGDGRTARALRRPHDPASGGARDLRRRAHAQRRADVDRAGDCRRRRRHRRRAGVFRRPDRLHRHGVRRSPSGTDFPSTCTSTSTSTPDRSCSIR